MEKKAEIKKIILGLGNKDVELSLEQAKKLHQLLSDMFGEKRVEYIPSWPIYIDRYRPYWDYPSPTWTCTADSNIKITYSADSQTVNLSV